jgi:hypothetical protein
MAVFGGGHDPKGGGVPPDPDLSKLPWGLILVAGVIVCALLLWLVGVI